METQAAQLQNTALQIEAQLKQKEFNNDLKLHMYGEVKQAIVHSDIKVQNAVLLVSVSKKTQCQIRKMI